MPEQITPEMTEQQPIDDAGESTEAGKWPNLCGLYLGTTIEKVIDRMDVPEPTEKLIFTQNTTRSEATTPLEDTMRLHTGTKFSVSLESSRSST